MTKENITRITLEEALRNKGRGQTDWEALDRAEADGIEPIPDPDEGVFDWSRAQVEMPQPKKPVSLRLDADVVDFFKTQGKGYQTRINAVLRTYMQAHPEEITPSS